VACWCAWTVIEVAHRSAELPTAAIDWSTSRAGLVAVTVLSALGMVAAPAVLRRRGASVTLSLVLVAVLVRPLPHPGWPPRGWVLVMCDVGQGDALVLATGPHQAAVIDAGPDPAVVDRCLSRLAVDTVPVLMLTHFHADHVDGLPGVLAGRRVG
jgi:competence protein ComEC